MHAESPLHVPKTLGDFALHVLMIVLSVLIALGIEEGVQSLHNHRNAEKAQAQIEAELKANLKETREALEANKARLVRLADWKRLLIEDVRRKMPADGVRRAASRPEAAMTFALDWPSFEHEAWDVALANHAIAYMPTDLQQRYAAAYALQRDATLASQQAAALLIGGTESRNTLVDLELDRGDAIDLLRLVSQAITAQSTVQIVLHQTEAQLLRSLGEVAQSGAH